jgi:hypothetical protein
MSPPTTWLSCLSNPARAAGVAEAGWLGALADQGREIRSGDAVGEIGQKLGLRARGELGAKPGFERVASDEVGLGRPGLDGGDRQRRKPGAEGALK